MRKLCLSCAGCFGMTTEEQISFLGEIGFDGFFSFETSVKDFPEPEQEARERALADIGKRLIGRI